MERDTKDSGAVRSPHVVHVLPADDVRVADIVRTQVERMNADEGGSEGLRTLVLTPTTDDAVRLARHVNDGLDASGALLVPVSTDPRSLRRLPATSAAAMAIDDSVALLKKSALKLDKVTSVVLAELDQLARSSTALDEVLAEVPKDADRIATTAAVTAEIDAILERHARRARRIQHEAAPLSPSSPEYVVCDVSQRTEILGRILDVIDPAHATVIAAEEDAESACTALAQLGYGPEDPLVEFSDGACPANESLVVLFTAPTSADDLSEVAEAKPARVVTLLLPDEVAGFRRIFGEGARALPLVDNRVATSRVQALRSTVAETLSKESLHHQLLALAPLFADHDPAEVAAALLRLYEMRPVATPASVAPPAFHPRADAAPAGARPSFSSGAAPRSRPAAASGDYATLFINVGEKDGATKGDLVGAISNEASISSQLIGAITLRQTFALVEVDRSVAQQVIEAISGKAIRGRVIAARLDDRAGAGSEGTPRGSRPARRPFDKGRGRSEGRSEGGPRGAASRGEGRPRSFGDRERPRRRDDDVGGPRAFRGDGPGRRPRAMGEDREWRERGERLKNARRSPRPRPGSHDR